MSNAIGSIRNTGDSSSSQPRSAAILGAPPRAAASSIRASGSALGVAEVDRQHRPPGDRRRDPRLEAQLAGGRDPALGRPGSASIASAASAAARPASRRAVHRRRPGVRGLAAELEAQPLDPGAAGDGRRPQALGLHPRPLLDVQLEVGAEPRPPRARTRSARSSSTPFSASTSASARPSASRRPASAVRVERAGEGRAAEEAAPEAGALLVRPVDQHERHAAAARRRPRRAARRAPPSPRAPRRASRRPGPSRGASRARPRRASGSAPLEPRPEVARLVGLGLEPELGQQLVR